MILMTCRHVSVATSVIKCPNNTTDPWHKMCSHIHELVGINQFPTTILYTGIVFIRKITRYLKTKGSNRKGMGKQCLNILPHQHMNNQQ